MDIERHKIVAKYQGNHTAEISCLSVTPDITRLFSAGGHDLCFYEIPEIKKGDSEKQVESYGKLPEIKGIYWMGINMHGE